MFSVFRQITFAWSFQKLLKFNSNECNSIPYYFKCYYLFVYSFFLRPGPDYELFSKYILDCSWYFHIISNLSPMSLYVSKRYIVPGMYMYIHIFNNNVLNVYNHSSWVSQSNIINRFSTSSTPNSCTSKIIQLTSRIKSHQHLFSQNKKKNKRILVIALFITITVFLVGILVNPY